MKEIICDMGKFAYEHPIYTCDTEKGAISELYKSVPTDEVVYEMIAKAIETDTFDFHLFGDINYIRPYGEAIASTIMSEFGTKEFSVLYN